MNMAIRFLFFILLVRQNKKMAGYPVQVNIAAQNYSESMILTFQDLYKPQYVSHHLHRHHHHHQYGTN